MKVCHMTSVHKRDDTRIFHKECTSLAKAGYDTYLVVCGENDEKNGVHIIGTGEQSKSRLKRMRFDTKKVYEAALAVDADIYHVHDPELLPYAVKLKKKGKKVIFDSHEDVPEQILEKEWLPMRKLVAKVYAAYESRQLKKLDAVIYVTPHMNIRLSKISRRTVMITNYPVVNDTGTVSYNAGSDYVCFAGGVRKDWCHDLIIKALQGTGLHYKVVGRGDESYIQSLKDSDCIFEYGGVIPHSETGKLLSGALAGMAVTVYSPNSAWELGTLGNNKLFEEMYAGLPVICTDFTLWKEIIERHKCGICVNPDSLEQIRNALVYIKEHPEEAAQMGRNGRQAVIVEYNWQQQEKKLLELYGKLESEK